MTTLSASILLFFFGLGCLFCFYRKNVVPRCPSLDVSSLNAFVGSEINGRGSSLSIVRTSPPNTHTHAHSDSFSLLVLTFNFQSLFSPLWLHLANPDLSSSFSGWPHLLIPWTQELKGYMSWVTRGLCKTVHPSWGWSCGHVEKTCCFIFRTGERAGLESGGSF